MATGSGSAKIETPDTAATVQGQTKVGETMAAKKVAEGDNVDNGKRHAEAICHALDLLRALECRLDNLSTHENRAMFAASQAIVHILLKPGNMATSRGECTLDALADSSERVNAYFSPSDSITVAEKLRQVQHKIDEILTVFEHGKTDQLAQAMHLRIAIDTLELAEQCGANTARTLPGYEGKGSRITEVVSALWKKKHVAHRDKLIRIALKAWGITSDGVRRIYASERK